MMTTGVVFVGGGLTFAIKSAQKDEDKSKLSSNQIEMKLWLPQKEENPRELLPTP